MLLYVDAPIDRNNMDKLEYQNRLKEHYTFANKHWDQYKIPEWNPKFSKEEESQSKAGKENYDRLVNDNTTDYSQQPFEVQEAKEILKITHKDDFLHIMSQPDSLRMNSINRMVKDRTKLKMHSSFPNDGRDQMQATYKQFGPHTENQEQRTKAQASPTPDLQTNIPPQAYDTNKATPQIHDNLENSDNFTQAAPKVAAAKRKSIYDREFARTKQYLQLEDEKKEILAKNEQIRKSTQSQNSDQSQHSVKDEGGKEDQPNDNFFQRLRNDYIKTVMIRSKIQARASNIIADKVVEIAKDPAEYLKNKVAGDVPKLTPKTLDWVKIVQPEIKRVESIYGTNKILTLATTMAVSEELNRRDQVMNNLGDSIQDYYVDRVGKINNMLILSPHIGAGNINYETARSLIHRFNELPNINTFHMQNMKRKIIGTEKELSQYMLTAHGTLMIGNSIMYLIIKDVESNNLLPASMSEIDIIQNLVDI